MHPAVCDMMVDLGLQEQKSQLYGDSVKHQVYIRWQIPGERLEYEKDGQKIEGPMTIGGYYTLSLSEKANLRKVLQGWRGKEFTAEEAAKFDISAVLGKPCTLNVIHKTGNDGKVRAKIDSVGPLIKGLPAPVLEGEPILYDGGEESSPVWSKLRPWMHETIKRQVSRRSRSSEDQALSQRASAAPRLRCRPRRRRAVLMTAAERRYRDWLSREHPDCVCGAPAEHHHHIIHLNNQRITKDEMLVIGLCTMPSMATTRPRLGGDRQFMEATGWNLVELAVLRRHNFEVRAMPSAVLPPSGLSRVSPSQAKPAAAIASEEGE
jgi:hypothetical protein